jgi:biotin carboxyl carrier protein
VAICESDEFAHEVTTTAFLTDHPHVRTQQPSHATLRAHALAAGAALWHHAGQQVADVAAGHLAEPAWRNVPRPGGVSIGFEGAAAGALGGGDGGLAVHRRARRSRPERATGPVRARGSFEWGLATTGDARGLQADEAVTWLEGVSVEVVDTGTTVIVVDADGVRRQIQVAVYPAGPDGAAEGVDSALEVWTDDAREHAVWQSPARFPDSDAAAGGGGPSAPVPGTIAAVLVEPGAAVSAGDTVVVLEAMKMEHRITADADGVVDEVLVSVGDSVDAHQVVVRLTAREEAE